jgi:small-conductance mechanosensitive channel
MLARVNPLTRAEQAFQAYFGLSPTAWHLVLSAFVVLGYMASRRVARRIIVRAVDDAGSRFQVARVATYVLGLISFVLLLNIWVQGFTGLATYLGLLSAGIAVALQDPLVNLAGWIFILARRPFKVGDRVQLAQFHGDVVDIRMFRFILLEIGNWVHADQSTGRVIHVPNGLVFKNPVANYDEAFGYIWNEIEVTLTFESNWRSAKDVLQRTVNDHAEKLTADAQRRIELAADSFHIQFTKLTPIVWTSVTDSGVRLTMRYLCKPRERRSSSSEMWESVLEELGKLPDVDLAYPTQRFFDNRTEGKVRAG